MTNAIPTLTFRIEPGYTCAQELSSPEFVSQNLLVGGLPAGSELQAIFLGKVAEHTRGKNIWVDCEGAHAIYVMGKRRSGKTYTLGVLLEGLASGSWIRQGTNKQAIVLLDTMNVFITMPYNIEDVYGSHSKYSAELKKWGLEKEPFNVVLFYPRGTTPPPEGRTKEIAIKPSDLSGDDWAALFGVDTYSDPMGQLISDLYERVVLEGYEDIKGGRLSAKADYSVDDLLVCIDSCQAISSGYHPDTIRAITTRLKAIRRLPVFSTTGINLKEVFCPGQVSILLLRDLGQDLRSLLVGILIKKIMEFRSVSDKYERLATVHLERHKALEEQNQKEEAQEEHRKYQEYLKEVQGGLPRGWVIIDEAHNYMPAKGITPSGEPLKKYVSEGRNLGLSIVVATQNPSALDPSIRRNADILLIHSMSMRDDISTADGMINTFLPNSFEFRSEKVSSRVFEQLVRSLPLGYALVSNDRANRVFVAKIRPRITVHGGVEY